MFSKKATKIDEIFTIDLTLTTYFQIDGEDFIIFCGLLRKQKLKKTTYWAASASSSGTMLFLLTEPRRAIFGEIAGAVISSSVKIDYCQNIDNFVILIIV